MPENCDAVREEYERIAASYDMRWRPYIDATLQSVLEAISLKGHEAVLDAACGTGELERRLLSQWPELHITGADLSPNMLQQARLKNPERQVQWIESDIAELPLPDSCFDYVICANSFHYFRDPEKTLTEFRRVLRSDGKLILVDWCDDFWVCKACSLWLRWTNPAFFRTYSLRACSSLLERRHLGILESTRFRIKCIWGLMRVVCRPHD